MLTLSYQSIEQGLGAIFLYDCKVAGWAEKPSCETPLQGDKTKPTEQLVELLPIALVTCSRVKSLGTDSDSVATNGTRSILSSVESGW